MKKYDFAGYATKNDVLCADGRTIRRGSFSSCDGVKVPLVWNHDHSDPFHVLGHAILEDRDDGVYAYCKFNDTESGLAAKRCVQNGDLMGLSIFANQLKQKANDVVHGVIREVSLVLAGANPQAKIDDVVTHDEESGLAAYMTTALGEDIELFHSDEEDNDEPLIGDTIVGDNDEQEPDVEETEDDKMSKTEMKHSDDNKDTNTKDKTVRQVFDEAMGKLSKDEQDVIYAVIGVAAKDSGKENEKGDSEEEMKHNIFDKETNKTGFLAHSDQQAIIALAKKNKINLSEAFDEYTDGGQLAHSIDTTGMDVATGDSTYGFNDPEFMFPEYKNYKNGFDWISRDMGWVGEVLNNVHRTPFLRVKSVFANITEDEARAKGYIKGERKKEEVFSLLKRKTDGQTIYKKQKLDKDDIDDITDFDVVSEVRAEMRVMLNEEAARAILIGDGRLASDDDKIDPTKIRPIITEPGLFNTLIGVPKATGDDDADVARALIDSAIRGRKHYKGSGNPTFFTTEDWLTEMLLLEDGIGHKLYKTEGELATALRVRKIVTVEPMDGCKVEVNGAAKPLIGVIVNLNDYNVGSNKGSRVDMFDDFDIDFNQYKYLLETRMSGALVKPFSALTLYVNASA